MTDKELLELAAKAAGIEIYTQIGNMIFYQVGIYLGHWNPLTSNDDALRLAVKLGVKIEILNNRMIPHTVANGKEEEHRDDPYAATRRTIVRAAAEIGKAL